MDFRRTILKESDEVEFALKPIKNTKLPRYHGYINQWPHTIGVILLIIVDYYLDKYCK